ncbi:MAG TPA: GNAT family N-acetyltransferase [Flavobacteriales bacterium]|jgi:diamine N-acetyltransferase|nr:GNAT family N-acetyltransferase [Flavobacteriales bacterium]
MNGERVQLRALEPGDLDDLYAWENNAEYWHLSNNSRPFSRELLRSFIESADDIFVSRQMRFIIELKNEKRSIGCLDFYDFDPLNQRAAIGILIGDEDDRKQGYATEALNIAALYAFNFLGMHQLHCSVLLDNIASIRLFENLGYVRCGIRKNWVRIGQEWKDEVLLQLINSREN